MFNLLKRVILKADEWVPGLQPVSIGSLSESRRIKKHSVVPFPLTVTAKLRILIDYQQRIVTGTQPQPSGADLANTFKYFTQTLLG